MKGSAGSAARSGAVFENEAEMAVGTEYWAHSLVSNFQAFGFYSKSEVSDINQNLICKRKYGTLEIKKRLP